MKKVISRAWSLVAGTAAWLFERRRAIAVCAVVLAALWIMYGYAQNGRYALHVEREGDSTWVYLLDTRTGDLTVRYGRWGGSDAYVVIHQNTGEAEPKGKGWVQQKGH
jgi:hypothetical protein